MKKDDFSLDENWVHVGCDDHRLACFLQTELDLSFRESIGELVGLLHFMMKKKHAFGENCKHFKEPHNLDVSNSNRICSAALSVFTSLPALQSL